GDGSLGFGRRCRFLVDIVAEVVERNVDYADASRRRMSRLRLVELVEGRGALSLAAPAAERLEEIGRVAELGVAVGRRPGDGRLGYRLLRTAGEGDHVEIGRSVAALEIVLGEGAAVETRGVRDALVTADRTQARNQRTRDLTLLGERCRIVVEGRERGFLG